MDGEDKLLKARSDASRAKSLLEDDMLKGAFAALKQSYADKLFTTTIDQPEAREKLYVAFRVVTEVERHLHAVIDDGKLADAELSHLIRMANPKKVWGQA